MLLPRTVRQTAPTIPLDPRNRRPQPAVREGFALVLAISLSGFILLLLLSLTALVKIETQASDQALIHQQARENARFAMLTALGEVQKYLGPDQAVSAPAELLEAPNATNWDFSSNYKQNRNWIGVWHTNADSNYRIDGKLAAPGSFIRWLVSTNTQPTGGSYNNLLENGTHDDLPQDYDPSGILDASSGRLNAANRTTDAILVGKGSVGWDVNNDGQINGASEVNADDFVIAEQLAIEDTTGARTGSMAWWVGDEGTKAASGHQDSQDTLNFSSPDQNRFAEFMTPGRTNLQRIDASEFSNWNLNQVSLISLQSDIGFVNAASPNPHENLRGRFHDLAVRTRGVLASTRHGELKKDLTFAMEDNTVFSREFLENSTPITNPLDPSGPQRTKKYLYHDFLKASNDNKTDGDFNLAGGLRTVANVPSMTILREFYQMKDIGPFTMASPFDETTSRGEFFNSGGHPGHEYDGPVNSNAGNWAWSSSNWVQEVNNQYHINNPMHPVLARIQFGVYFEYVAPSIAPPTSADLKICLQPVLAMYNPYNFPIESDGYWLQIQPQCILRITVNGTTTEARLSEFLPTTPWNGNTFFRWVIPAATYEPGETQLFGLAADDFRYETGTANSWGPPLATSVGGAFVWSINRAKNASSTGEESIEQGSPRYGLTSTEKSNLIPASSGTSMEIEVLWEQNTGQFLEIKDFPTAVTSPWRSFFYQHANDLHLAGFQGPYDEITANVASPNNVVGTSWSATAGSLPSSPIFAQISYLKTTTEDDRLMRNLVEGNVRATSLSGRPGGMDVPFVYTKPGGYGGAGVATSGMGLGSYTGSRDYPIAAPYNAKLEVSASEINPSIFPSSNTMPWGNSIKISDGQRNVTLFDIPKERLTSIAQFQHANLARFSADPTYALGNSYANSRIPRTVTEQNNFCGMNSYIAFDLSYHFNEELYDRYYLSTLDHANLNGATLQSYQNDTASPLQHRLRFEIPEFEQDTALGTLANRISEPGTSTSTLGNSGFDVSAGYFMIDGAFNVNSTSVDAWKAFLGQTAGHEIPNFDYDYAYPSASNWNLENNVYFSRLSSPNVAGGFASASDGEAFFNSYRVINDAQLTALATEMVNQVKARGPFLSLADFINRDLVDSASGDMGALQAALDASSVGINDSAEVDAMTSGTLPSNLSGGTQFTSGADAEMVGKQNTGFPGWVTQADVLQHIGPMLQARSDTFKIRAFGDSWNPVTQEIEARAWCEAIVQRVSQPLDDSPSNSQFAKPSLSANYGNPNQWNFGRRFKVISFRWLTEDDV